MILPTWFDHLDKSFLQRSSMQKNLAAYENKDPLILKTLIKPLTNCLLSCESKKLLFIVHNVRSMKCILHTRLKKLKIVKLKKSLNQTFLTVCHHHHCYLLFVVIFYCFIVAIRKQCSSWKSSKELSLILKSMYVKVWI